MPARDVQSKEEDSVMGSADMTVIISYLFIDYYSHVLMH